MRVAPLKLAVAGLLLALGACSQRTSDDIAGTHELRGSYSAGFETSGFVACDHPARTTAWWISFEPGSTTPALDSIHRELEASVGERRAHLYIEVHGTVSAVGQYGHLGAYSRRLTVDSVRRIATWSDSSCVRE